MILQRANQYPRGKLKAAAYPDDLRAEGTVKQIKYWWEQLCKLGPKLDVFQR